MTDRTIALADATLQSVEWTDAGVELRFEYDNLSTRLIFKKPLYISIGAGSAGVVAEGLETRGLADLAKILSNRALPDTVLDMARSEALVLTRTKVFVVRAIAGDDIVVVADDLLSEAD